MATFSKGYFSTPIQIPNAKSLTLSDADNSANVSIKPSNTTTSYQMELPSAIGSASQVLTINSISGSDKAVLAWTTVSSNGVAADDISVGDSNIFITTSTGNVRINTSDEFLALQYSGSNVLLLENTNTAKIIPITQSTSTTTGALVVSGGAGIASNLNVGGNVVITEDVRLASDAGVLYFGADNDVSLTHVADTGLLLNSTSQLQFRDSTEYINSSADGQLDINATTEIQLQSSRANVAGTLYVANSIYAENETEASSNSTGSLVVSGGAGIASNLHVGGNVFVAKATTLSSTLGVTGATTLSSTLDVTGAANINDTTPSTSSTTGALIVDGGVGVANNINIGNDLSVGANTSLSGNFIQSVSSFLGLGTTQNLWGSGKNTSVKSIYANTAAAFNYYSNTSTSYTEGQLMHIFYTNNSGGTANATVDFGASNLYAGSGTAQYLKFDISGQSATLIYIGGETNVQGWRVINTGATVS